MTTKAEQAAQIEAQSKQITDLQRKLQQTQWALEGEQMSWARLVTDNNAIYGMLDDLFGFKVYGAPGGGRYDETEWIIEDKETHEILVDRCKPAAAAYYEAITLRLAKNNIE